MAELPRQPVLGDRQGPGDRAGAVGAGDQARLPTPARLDAHLRDGPLQQGAYGGGTRVVQEAGARPKGFPAARPHAANQITALNGDTSGWSYDKNGNELAGASTLGARTGETYNDFNQLTALTTAGTTHHYTYAGTDNSQRLTEDTTRIDQGPLGISTTTTGSTSTGIVRDPAGTLIGMTTNGAAHYYTTNNQDAPATLTNPTGTVENTWDYGPTGSPRPTTSTTVAQPFGYTGAYLDTTGLYKMGARSYDRTTNRFTQPDPSGKETNPYLYATGDPINRVDPTGLFGWPEVGALVLGTAIGAAATLVTRSPLAGGIIGGCAVGALAEGFNGNGAADMGEACVAGAIAGGILGGAASLIP
ncbi:RHS repeat-associated core domain-containing protein [Streptomyces sp. NPDC058420]|uniref:RHS repeat-associated core domain-containing protein n=1 Tax=Streptomyces sp. NPDC058420 TaxID=3346489 RepID=UPI00365C77C9